MDNLSQSEKNVLDSFVHQMTELRSTMSPNETVSVGIAGDIVNEVLSQLKNQRRRVIELEQIVESNYKNVQQLLSTSKTDIDNSVAYVEAQMTKFPNLKSIKPDLEIKRIQLSRRHSNMFKAAMVYINIQNETVQRPSLETMIENLRDTIPESMIRKNYNLTKINAFIDKYRDILIE